MIFEILAKKYFDMCFDNWLSFMHHIISTFSLCYMLSTNLYIYKYVLSNMDIFYKKNREKN
jgi:hypothetical protein